MTRLLPYTSQLAAVVKRPVNDIRKPTLRCQSTLSSARSFAREGHTGVADVEKVEGRIDLNIFRDIAWTPEIPLQLRGFHEFPAMKKWFTDVSDGPSVSFRQTMEPYGDVVMPYELMTPAYSGTSPDQRLKNLRNLQEWLQSPEQAGGVHDNLSVIVGHLLQSIEGSQSHFLQFDAPLSLLLRACQFNRTRSSAAERIKQLYVAQSNLSNLPQPLSEDLPVPAIVRHAGKGDIYDSSVWLGLQPTYTPLHRDPNPNLFCQMVGSKTVRLMRPQSGAALYACVRRQLGSMGSSRFRGSEMMDGPERELLHRAVWANAEGSNDVKQARLGPGDALFIPKGWWHSVASTGHEAELNASVNWWFR